MRPIAFGYIMSFLLFGVSLIWLSAFSLPTSQPPQSIQTQGGYAVETLVNDIFVTGGCNSISNIQAIGHPDGIGYFENGMSSIGLNRGIIMSTGPIQFAEGPNNVTDASGNFESNMGDIDLDSLATGEVRDVVGLSFDFIPLDSFISFHYVFASEEYCEFVGSNYNDVFGFFISGPGIEGNFSNNAENVALIPNTDNYVSINSVNHISNSSYYIGNELEDDAIECNFPYVPSPNYSHIEYDGFTQKLTAVLKLIPCETYHIRLVVADVADNYYDSAVFLEANSFHIGGAVQLNAVSPTNPDLIVYEGCPDAYFEFQRVQTDYIDFPINVNFGVSDLSTAQSGLDFSPFPGTITIPAGQIGVQLPVSILNDQLPEGQEALVLELDIPCSCYADTATLFIQDAPELVLELPDVPICEGEQTTFEPTIVGGVPPFSYNWSDQSDAEYIQIQAGIDASFSLTVTDACNTNVADTAAVLVVQPPEAYLSGSLDICEGDTAYLDVSFTGIPPFRIRYRVNGVLQTAIDNIETSLFGLPVTQAGEYEIVQFNDAACDGVWGGTGHVEVTTLVFNAAVQPVQCFGGSDGRISVEITGGVPPYQFEWLESSATNLSLEELPAGMYRLWAQDAQGCEWVEAIEVPSPEPLGMAELECEDYQQDDLQLQAMGGTPPYLYSIDGQRFFDQSLFDTLEPGTNYLLTIEDAAGCKTEVDFLMPMPYDRMVDLPSVIRVKHGEEHQILPMLNIPESLVANIRWLPTENLSCSDCLSPIHTALENEVFTLKIFDQFGCQDEFEVAVVIDPGVDIYLPTAFSPNGDQINDRLVIYANEIQVEQILLYRVFNRWGDMLYERSNFQPNDEQFGWDGTFLGKPMDTGLYVYFIKIQLSNGDHKILNGSAILIK